MSVKSPAVRIPFPSGRPLRERVDRALGFLAQHDVAFHCPLLEQADRWNSDPGYLCGTDRQRIDEIVAMWTQGEPSVVWCGRGGYGATRLLGFLDLMKLPEMAIARSRFLGYSDITALFAYIRTRELPIDCVHAPVVTEIPDHPQPEAVLAALAGTPCPIPVKAAATSSFHGPIWGGNLAVLASLAGTPWLPRIARGALFLEDIEEAPYRLDRFVTQLHDCGFFDDAQGVFLGQFTRCGSDGAGLAAVKQRLAELDIAVLGELPVGHEALHLPLFFDLEYRFDPTDATLRPQGDRVDALGVRTAWHGANDRG